MGRMRGIIEEPTGLRYVPSLLSEDQGRDLLERVRGLEFDEVRMQAAKILPRKRQEQQRPSGDSRQICRCSKARTPIRRRTGQRDRPLSLI
jgi:hypothetical protein